MFMPVLLNFGANFELLDLLQNDQRGLAISLIQINLNNINTW